jgi:hypothetical protein
MKGSVGYEILNIGCVAKSALAVYLEISYARKFVLFVFYAFFAQRLDSGRISGGGISTSFRSKFQFQKC